MIRLPVSGITVELRPSTGAEDILLLESSAGEAETSVAVLERLAERRDGADFDVASLPLHDIEWLWLDLRRRLLGDTVSARARCPVESCGAPTDVSFLISQYLEHHRPRRPANVERQAEGWFQLRESEVSFRLVTAADLLATSESKDRKRDLARLTIRPEGTSGRDLRRVEQALEALAPPLSNEIKGRCPECGGAILFFFAVQSYVQCELRYEAELLYEDGHLLAERYHWSEEEILSLPRTRRVHYAALTLRTAGVN